MIGIVIPVTGPFIEMHGDPQLAQLQELCGGGLIQAVPLPAFLGDAADHATSYVNEEGKFRDDLILNRRATDFFVPGSGLMWGDYIAGTLVVCGFDPRTGDHAELPGPVLTRIRVIEREAA